MIFYWEETGHWTWESLKVTAASFDLLPIMADIRINGISCSHQSIATAGWRGPNPFKRWFGSILPALAKHCGSRCGRNCLKGETHLHCSKTEYHWQTSGVEVMLRYCWAVKHIIRLYLTHSEAFSLSLYCIWFNATHLPLHQQNQGTFHQPYPTFSSAALQAVDLSSLLSF